MNKICGYTCEHNKGGVCQITMCDKNIVMTTTTNEPFEQKFNVKYDEQGVEKFARWLDPTIEEYKKEIERLNNIRNEAIVFIRKYIPFYDNDLFNNECRLRKYKRHQKYTEEFINSLIDILELKEDKNE